MNRKSPSFSVLVSVFLFGFISTGCSVQYVKDDRTHVLGFGYHTIEKMFPEGADLAAIVVNSKVLGIKLGRLKGIFMVCDRSTVAIHPRRS